MAEGTSRKRTGDCLKSSTGARGSPKSQQRVFILFETETEKDMELRYRLGVTLAQRQEMTCFTLFDVTDSKKQSEIGSYDEMIKKADKIVVLLTSSFNSSRMAASAFDFARNWCVEQNRSNIVIATKTKSVPQSYAQFPRVLMTKKSWIGNLIKCLKSPDGSMPKIIKPGEVKPLSLDLLYHDSEKEISTSLPELSDNQPHLPKHKLDAMKAYALLQAKPLDFKRFLNDDCAIPAKRNAQGDKGTIQFLSRKLGTKRQNGKKKTPRRKTDSCLYSRSLLFDEEWNALEPGRGDAIVPSRTQIEGACAADPSVTNQKEVSSTSKLFSEDTLIKDKIQQEGNAEPVKTNQRSHVKIKGSEARSINGQGRIWSWNRNPKQALLALQDLLTGPTFQDLSGTDSVMIFCATSDLQTLGRNSIRVKSRTAAKPKTKKVQESSGDVKQSVDDEDQESKYSRSQCTKESKKLRRSESEGKCEAQRRKIETRTKDSFKRYARCYNKSQSDPTEPNFIPANETKFSTNIPSQKVKDETEKPVQRRQNVEPENPKTESLCQDVREPELDLKAKLQQSSGPSWV